MRRTITGFLLAIALMATSVTMAVARGQMAGATGIVICSGYGIVTITVDAEGNPTGPVHPCPDCLAGGGAALLPDLPALLRPETRATLVVRPDLPRGQPQDRPATQARGPPLPA